jgi:hypothetical protein
MRCGLLSVVAALPTLVVLAGRKVGAIATVTTPASTRPSQPPTAVAVRADRSTGSRARAIHRPPSASPAPSQAILDTPPPSPSPTESNSAIATTLRTMAR